MNTNLLTCFASDLVCLAYILIALHCWLLGYKFTHEAEKDHNVLEKKFIHLHWTSKSALLHPFYAQQSISRFSHTCDGNIVEIEIEIQYPLSPFELPMFMRAIHAITNAIAIIITM